MAVHVGTKDVTTAGSREQMTATVISVQSVFVKAKQGNAGLAYITDTVTGANKFPLDSGEGVTLPVTDITTIYVDVAVNGEGVDWIAV